MKQILQNLKTGLTQLEDIPAPQSKKGHLLIRTSASLISAGTERMLIDFGKAGMLEKARQQPEKVKQVIDKIRTDGLLPTVEAVQNKLDQPIPLGYCNVGVIQEISGHQMRMSDLSPGDRIVSNGPHAEIGCVPRNLCVKIPDRVSDEEAAFAVAGAIGLQGIRLAQPAIGESFVVTGLGLIGLLTVQILLANGCKVLGIDIDSSKCALARELGAETADLSNGEDPINASTVFSNGRGADGVLITAATKSSEPVHQAAQMCRKRGRIVLTGVTGLELNRADFYEKELSFQVSCSYGPGRYDPEYEEKGRDYPIGFVRWTEQRNFEAVLDLMASGRLNVKPLISHRFPFEKALNAYDLISENKEPYLGIILTYHSEAEKRKDETRFLKHTVELKPGDESSVKSHEPAVGIIGAGNFTGQVLLPALKKSGIKLKAIASAGGVSGTHLGKKFGFENSTTDTDTIFNDPEIDTVFITTRHNTHAGFVIQALKTGKNVFVEKPLCLNMEELDEIADVYKSQTANRKSQILMVGFNRRFAPHVVKIKELMKTVKEPKSFIMTVNAGMIPLNHWTQDINIGGGRIIGEACHFIDLLRFIANSGITDHYISKLHTGTGDTVTIQLSFENGSMGTVHYFANGNKSFPKERLEIFCGGRILSMDNFKVLKGYGWKNCNKMKLWHQDKGHAAGVKAFVQAIQNGKPSPIKFEEIFEVMKITMLLSEK
ncbi:bi-domain-containing oxidoreductase [Desulfococcaceae bacterium HSG7]|nr:bi-domain-containing oxidoreductase [Desulfococcaceae bacterium HSG7]